MDFDVIIDLELDKIDNILKKIDEDPELDDVKSTEPNLWNGMSNFMVVFTKPHYLP